MKRVLVLPKWYPWPDRPVHGLFCREQARAAALANDVRVLAFTPEPMRGATLHRIWEDVEEPVPTTRLVYRRPRVRAAARNRRRRTATRPGRRQWSSWRRSARTTHAARGAGTVSTSTCHAVRATLGSLQMVVQ